MFEKIKKIVSVLLVVTMLVPMSTPVLAYSNEPTDISYEYGEQDINEIATLLELYFSKLGYVNEQGDYIVTDYKLLERLYSEGDLFARKVKATESSQISFRSFSGLSQCVFDEYFGPFIKFLNGSYLESFEKALLQESWRQAGAILTRALAEISKRVGYKVSGAFAIAELSYYVYLCRSHI